MKKLIIISMLVGLSSMFAKNWSYTYYDGGVRCEVLAYKDNSKSRKFWASFGNVMGAAMAGAGLAGNEVKYNNNGLISQWASSADSVDRYFFINVERNLSETEAKPIGSMHLNKLIESNAPFINDKKLAKLINKVDLPYINMYRVGEYEPYVVIEHSIHGKGKDKMVEVVCHNK